MDETKPREAMAADELEALRMDNEGCGSRPQESTPDKGGSDRKNEQPSAEGAHGS